MFRETWPWIPLASVHLIIDINPIHYPTLAPMKSWCAETHDWWRGSKGSHFLAYCLPFLWHTCFNSHERCKFRVFFWLFLALVDFQDDLCTLWRLGAIPFANVFCSSSLSLTHIQHPIPLLFHPTILLPNSLVQFPWITSPNGSSKIDCTRSTNPKQARTAFFSFLGLDSVNASKVGGWRLVETVPVILRDVFGRCDAMGHPCNTFQHPWCKHSNFLEFLLPVFHVPVFLSLVSRLSGGA